MKQNRVVYLLHLNYCETSPYILNVSCDDVYDYSWVKDEVTRKYFD